MIFIKNRPVTRSTPLYCNSNESQSVSGRGTLMSIIKQKIMESAMRYFSEKGYAATSIQEIADDCGIAKGSLYKFFQSKEDLLIELHHEQQKSLYDEIDRIRADRALSLREAFIRETEYHFEFFMQNKFIMREIKEMSSTSGKIAPCLHRLRSNILSYSKDGLLVYLGKDIKPNVWDMVAVYTGIMREYMILLVFENKPLHVSDVAVFIVDRMEEMASNIHKKQLKSILQDAMMNEIIELGAECSLSVVEHRTNLLQTLCSTIMEMTATNYRKTELKEAVALLREQFDNEQPKAVMVKSLLNFLGEEHPLKGIVRQLEQLAAKVH
jgi:AcrR family transcriptional regulator